jgi:hypothetical protein
VSTPGSLAEGDMFFNNNSLQFYEGAARTVVHTTSAPSGDVTGTYVAMNVGKLHGHSIESGTPPANSVLQYISSTWQHVQGVTPDYDSGWFTMNVNSSTSKTHSIGVIPRQVMCFVSSSSTGNPAQLAGWGHAISNEVSDRGTIVCDITTTALTCRTGTRASPYGVFDSYGFGGTRVNYGNGTYVRVMLWK